MLFVVPLCSFREFSSEFPVREKQGICLCGVCTASPGPSTARAGPCPLCAHTHTGQASWCSWEGRGQQGKGKDTISSLLFPNRGAHSRVLSRGPCLCSEFRSQNPTEISELGFLGFSLCPRLELAGLNFTEGAYHHQDHTCGQGLPLPSSLPAPQEPIQRPSVDHFSLGMLMVQKLKKAAFSWREENTRTLASLHLKQLNSNV